MMNAVAEAAARLIEYFEARNAEDRARGYPPGFEDAIRRLRVSLEQATTEEARARWAADLCTSIWATYQSGSDRRFIEPARRLAVALLTASALDPAAMA